jgi:hypothetical protein
MRDLCDAELMYCEVVKLTFQANANYGTWTKIDFDFNYEKHIIREFGESFSLIRIV